MVKYFFASCVTQKTDFKNSILEQMTLEKLPTLCIINIILYPEPSMSFFIVRFLCVHCQTEMLPRPLFIYFYTHKNKICAHLQIIHLYFDRYAKFTFDLQGKNSI